MNTAGHRRALPCAFAVVVLTLHAAMLAWSAFVHSPTHNEVFHLAAGVSHIKLGRFDLYRANPPLVRTVAAVPVVFSGAHADWRSYDTDPHRRAEYAVGFDFLYANDVRTVWLITVARWACIPFSVLGGWMCFVWASRLFGMASGLVALALWCTCPYILGHGALITADSHAAAIGVTATYAFCLWLKQPTAVRTFTTGILLGTAQLAKTTLLVFYPLWPMIWLIYRFPSRHSMKTPDWLREVAFMLLFIVVSVFVINLGYGFESSFRPIGDFDFQTCLFSGATSLDDVPEKGSNRYAGTWLGPVPTPLPANYVQGMDTQRLDFERRAWSFLRGAWQRGGWWYFYLYALAIKIPLGTWLLAVLAVGVSLFDPKKYSAACRDELALILPFFAILVVVSSQTGMGLHSRYAIPLLPFMFVWISKVARAFEDRNWRIGCLILVALSWSVASSLYHYPHSLSYFNGLIGGPRNGYAYLAKSDSSWGQDLLFLKRWVDKHPEARSLHLASCGPFDPRLAGLDFVLPRVAPRRRLASLKQTSLEELGPQPGWFAIDSAFFNGNDPLSAADGKGGWEEPSERKGYDLSYFLRFQPVAVAGYSIYIYHVTLGDANRVRHELGLPELPRSPQVKRTPSAKPVLDAELELQAGGNADERQ